MTNSHWLMALKVGKVKTGKDKTVSLVLIPFGS